MKNQATARAALLAIFFGLITACGKTANTGNDPVSTKADFIISEQLLKAGIQPDPEEGYVGDSSETFCAPAKITVANNTTKPVALALGYDQSERGGSVGLVQPGGSLDIDFADPGEIIIDENETRKSLFAFKVEKCEEASKTTTAVSGEAKNSSKQASGEAAASRTAQCLITNNEDGPLLDGPCLFEAGSAGSFSLETAESPGGGDLVPGVYSLSLTVTSKGEGYVRGLTSDGTNSMWGEVERSKSDPACWEGSDFSVCVR